MARRQITGAQHHGRDRIQLQQGLHSPDVAGRVGGHVVAGAVGWLAARQPLAEGPTSTFAASKCSRPSFPLKTVAARSLDERARELGNPMSRDWARKAVDIAGDMDWAHGSSIEGPWHPCA